MGGIVIDGDGTAQGYPDWQHAQHHEGQHQQAQAPTGAGLCGLRLKEPVN